MYVLLRDLTFYDDRLHRTHNDLSSFNNTTGVKMDPKDKEYDLKFDPNQELKSKNHLPENEKYKGIVHAFLEKSKEMFVSYLAWLKDRIKEEGAEN